MGGYDPYKEIYCSDKSQTFIPLIWWHL